MAGSGNVTSFAKRTLLVLALLLVAGIADSVWMGMKARSAAISSAVSQVQTISNRSLTLVLHPTDLTGVAFGDRRAALSDQITASVLDTSPFTSVTLWSADGQILYSTDTGRIGNQLPGERDRIKAAIAGVVQTRDADGIFSVMVPFKLPSGVGTTTVIEMVKSDTAIASAAGPWRTNALFLTVLLGFVTFLLFKVRRIGEVLGAHLSFSKPAVAANQPPPLPIARSRPMGMPSVGIREEAEARRRAEERADSAEKRATTLQEKYRKALEDLQEAQHDLRAKPGNSRIVPQLEDRALKAEGRVRTLEGQIQALQSEREKLAEDLTEAMRATGAEGRRGASSEELERLLQTEAETIGLRAELDGAQAQLALLGREVEQLRADPGRDSLQEEIDAAHIQSLRSRESAETAMAELDTAQTELSNLREEVRELRNQDQKAAILEDELRAAKAEIEGLSVTSEHGQEAAAELEDKVRAIREEFQREVASMETGYRDQLAQRDVELADRVAAAEMKARDSATDLGTTKKALQEALEEAAGARDRLLRQADQHAATAAEFEAMRAELAQRQERFDKAGDQAKKAEAESQTVSSKLEKTRADLLAAREQVEAQKARADELSTALALSDGEAKEATKRVVELQTQFEGAARSNAELNMRMQELKSRRALELAGTEGKADLDEILRVTQERLAGQTEKLIHAEERVHELERDVTTLSRHNEEIEDDLRQRQMSGAMKQLRGETGPPESAPEIPETAAPTDQTASQDRRTPSPFVLELSMDAKKSLTRILGVTQVLKHKKDGKDQSTLIKQLTALTRHLDHTVSDLMDAESLATGTVEVNVKRTDLKALVSRVVDESGVGADHDVNMELESVVVGIDQRRTEQLLSGMLRTCADRTPAGKGIAVKLSRVDGGALLFVEDGQSSKNAVLSPVVQRFAEVQGGWARLEPLEAGGTSFRVYLPDGGPDQTAEGDDKLQHGAQNSDQENGRNHVVAEEPWDNSGEKILVDELHRLSELEPEKSRRR
jgi:hypothetical protein